MQNKDAILSLSADRGVFHDVTSDAVDVRQIRRHDHNTRQHHSAVRSEHEFHADVCAEILAWREVVVTGSSTALADLRHYIAKHRPHTTDHIAQYEVLGHATDRELLALGRAIFERRRRSGLASGSLQ